MANGTSKSNNPRRRRPGPGRPTVKIHVGRELSSPLADKALGALFGGLQAVSDKTLEDHSREGYKLYVNMLRKDAQLAMCFRMRAHIVMAQGYNIIPGPEDPDDDAGLAGFIDDVFADIEHFHLSRSRFFRAMAYGFQPVEIVYKLRPDGYYGIKEFKTRNPDRFRFDEKGDLVLAGSGGIGKTDLPQINFMANTWGSDETPYGEGLLRELYPLWFAKSNGIKDFLRYIEKYGTPFLWANYPRGISKDEQNALLEVLKVMHANAVGIGPEGTDFKTIELKPYGVVNLYKFLIDEYVDRQYAKSILGQTLSTESKSGTFALAKFQSKSQQHICEEDSRWQQEQFNDVIKRMVDINFGTQDQGVYPRFRIPFEEEKDLAAYLNAVSLAVNQLGLQVGEDWLREQIGIPAPAEDDLPLTGKKMPAVSFPGMEVGEEGLDDFGKQEEASGL